MSACLAAAVPHTRTGGCRSGGRRGTECPRPSERAGSRSPRRKNLVFFILGKSAELSSNSDSGTGMHISRSWIPSRTWRSACVGPPTTSARLRDSDRKIHNLFRPGTRRAPGAERWRQGARLNARPGFRPGRRQSVWWVCGAGMAVWGDPAARLENE